MEIKNPDESSIEDVIEQVGINDVERIYVIKLENYDIYSVKTNDKIIEKNGNFDVIPSKLICYCDGTGNAFMNVNEVKYLYDMRELQIDEVLNIKYGDKFEIVIDERPLYD